MCTGIANPGPPPPLSPAVAPVDVVVAWITGWRILAAAAPVLAAAAAIAAAAASTAGLVIKGCGRPGIMPSAAPFADNGKLP